MYCWFCCFFEVKHYQYLSIFNNIDNSNNINIFIFIFLPFIYNRFYPLYFLSRIRIFAMFVFVPLVYYFRHSVWQDLASNSYLFIFSWLDWEQFQTISYMSYSLAISSSMTFQILKEFLFCRLSAVDFFLKYYLYLIIVCDQQIILYHQNYH